MLTVYDFEAQTIDGELQKLEIYRGRWLLIVNVASRCSFTPQYDGLERLYRRLKDNGLTILGFPCNQFGRQEPADENQIKGFCTSRYGVSFPMFAKIKVNGNDCHPLYRYLTSERKGIFYIKLIKWNFTKFLTDPCGAVVRRYGPTVTPKSIELDLQARLSPYPSNAAP